MCVKVRWCHISMYKLPYQPVIILFGLPCRPHDISLVLPLTLCRYEPPPNKDAPRNPAMYGLREIPDTDPNLGAPVLTARNLAMLDNHGGVLPPVVAPGEALQRRGSKTRKTLELNNPSTLLHSSTVLAANEAPGGPPGAVGSSPVLGGPQDGMPMPPPCWVPGQPLQPPGQMPMMPMMMPPGGPLPPGALGPRPTLTKRMIQEMHKLRQQDELMMGAVFDPLPLPSSPHDKNQGTQTMLKRPKGFLDKYMYRRYDA